ncbi:hypothetical protein HU200_048231 [Digitaria exilis]|uniref:GRF-type domain-containing protein n=1 Tax=Digitaria exilis TaxID=1010633 RepID=A0A835AVZ6_9POAL|nr:hypothetical protein HU200_048231 [Digitaria exilis]
MSSSTSSRGSWSSTAGSRRSPIPYRKKPLDYEPAVLCHCGMKAALWISWSNDNPGRRYLKCYRARVSNTTEGGCGFITWYEGPCNPFVASLLVDLRDAVWGLKDVNTALRLQLDDVTMRLEQEKNDAIALKELQRMEKEEEQLKLRDGRTNKAGGDRCLIIAVCVALCATWIWMALH